MNSPSINNLLKQTAPMPTSPVGPSVDSKEFERYLHEASSPVTTAAKPAPKREPETPQSEPAPESNTVESADQEQAESSEHQSHTKDTANEQPVSREQESASKEDDDDQDEVVLSAAAVASATSQDGKPAPQDVGDGKDGLANDTANSDQDPKQSKSETPLKADNIETNLDKKQLEAESDVEQVSSEKANGSNVKSQVSTEETSDIQAAEVVKQPEHRLTNPAHESAESKETRKDSRLQVKPDGQSESLQEVSSPGGKTKSEIGPSTQGLPPVVSDASGPAATLKTDTVSPSSSGPNSSPATAVQMVPSTTPHHSEAASSQAGHETAAPTIDRGRFVQRVANAFRSAQQNDGEIQLRLSPPELGSLKIEIAVRHGVLTAKLEAETAHAKHSLLDNLPALRHRLAEQDIRIEKFEVDIRRDGGQGQSGTEDRESRDRSHRGDTSQRSRMNTESEVATSRVPRSAMSLTPDSLDVRI